MTRASGRVGMGDPVGPFDHAVWAYSSDEDRAALATWWLEDGLRNGQKALYCADEPVDRLYADVSGLSRAQVAVASGALHLVPTDMIYDLSGPIDPEHQIAAYAAVVDQAINDGFRGVRVACDITPLIVDPSRREAHLRWEQYADRYISEHPLTPLCMYDARRVRGLDAIACGHPLQGPEPQPFSLHAVSQRRAVLEGEADGCNAKLLGDVLAAMPVTDEVDVSGLRFVDGRTAWTLYREVTRRRDAGQPVRLAGATAMLQRLWMVLGFDPSLLQRPGPTLTTA